jgi:MFS family permease
VFPLYLRDSGVDSYLLYAVVLSLSPLLELSTVLAFGAYIDRAGRKTVLVGGAALSAVALALIAASDNAVWVGVVNGLHGVSAAAILVSSLALITDYAAHSNRGREMGAFEFVQVFGWLAGFVVGGVLAEVFASDLRYAYLVSAALGAVGCIYAWANVTEPKRHEHMAEQLGWSHLVSVLRQRAVVLLIMPWLLVYILISSIFTFASKAGFEEAKLTGYQLSLALGGGGVFLLVTFVLFGRLSDRYGRMPIMLVGAVGMVGVMSTVGVFFRMTGGDIGSPLLPWFLVPGGAFAFMAGAFGPAALASLADVSHRTRHGITMGLYSFVISLAMTVGPILSGAVIDAWAGPGMFALMGAISVAMMVLVLVRWWDAAREGRGTGQDGAGGPPA